MADPLSLLRQYNIDRKPITERNDQIIFGEHSWPKFVKTSYLVWGSGKDGISKDYYTLECLLFLLKNVQLPHPAYVRKARDENVPYLRRPDRKKLLAYLNGETSTSASIDKNASIEVSTTVKHVAEEQNQQENVKKPRLEEDEVQRAKDQLNTIKESSVATEHIRSLSDALSLEMIAAIKAKRLAKKRSTIKNDNDMQQITDNQHILDYDVAVTRNIISQERPWRTCETILKKTGKEHAEGDVVQEIIPEKICSHTEFVNVSDNLCLDTSNNKNNENIDKNKNLLEETSFKNVKEPQEDLKSSPDEENEFALFGKIVGMQLQQLPLSDAVDLQIEILTLISESRLRVLSKLNKSTPPLSV